MEPKSKKGQTFNTREIPIVYGNSSDDSSDSDQQRHTAQLIECTTLKVKYLETECQQLNDENKDLQQTLRINKEIISSFMASDEPDL